MDESVVIKSGAIEDTGEDLSEPSEMSVHELEMILAVLFYRDTHMQATTSSRATRISTIWQEFAWHAASAMSLNFMVQLVVFV